MKKYMLAVLLLLCLVIPSEAVIYYAVPGGEPMGDGSGSSWANASSLYQLTARTDIGYATGSQVDEIWVKKRNLFSK